MVGETLATPGFGRFEARERLELVVQDPFLTDTGRQAHFVLPACTYAEKEGTFTNLEGRPARAPGHGSRGESLFGLAH